MMMTGTSWLGLGRGLREVGATERVIRGSLPVDRTTVIISLATMSLSVTPWSRPSPASSNASGSSCGEIVHPLPSPQ